MEGEDGEGQDEVSVVRWLLGTVYDCGLWDQDCVMNPTMVHIQDIDFMIFLFSGSRRHLANLHQPQPHTH